MNLPALQTSNDITVPKPVVFTPRILKVIWQNLDFYGLFINNPNAPSEDAFQTHYSRLVPDPVISWTDLADGVTYLYDLSINQAQVTPTRKPYADRMDRLNKKLWEVLPPELLDTEDNWKAAWLKAAKKLDLATMRFLIEQGFDVNVPDENGLTALYHAVIPNGGSYDAVALLVEAGADLTLPNHTVDTLIEEGWASVSGNGEASEMRSIEAYLRAGVSDQ